MLGPEEIEVPDVGVLVFRGTDGRSLGARLDKIGEAKSGQRAARRPSWAADEAHATARIFACSNCHVVSWKVCFSSAGLK